MVPRSGCFVLALTASLASWAAGAEAEPIDFARDIRPILSANCFKCHGPDDKQREAELRLDTREGLSAEHDGRVPFVAGKPEKSEAIRRINSADDDERMPPPDTGKKLSQREKELIKRWVAAGAVWSGHWAFTAPQRPAVPTPKRADWVRNPFDAFVLARLEKLGKNPSPEADRVTLLRRLSLDLTGLPPTIEQIDAFLADEAPGAFERQVERLLNSLHYGERWGRHWLDAARYADSDGYEKDKSRQVWFYRDWVIGALNRDLPYDQFVVEQLAGDQLDNATQDQIVATGFLRNSMINEEGGVDPEQFRMEAMFDRMDAIGKGILGLTIQCAQCHNHKFDPLTQEEYYRLFAFINDSHEANVVVYTPEQQMRRAEILRQIGQIEAELKHVTPDWPTRQAAWEEAARKQEVQWTVLRPEAEEISTGGQKYLPLEDGSLLAQGYAPTKHRVKLTAKTDRPRITAIRLELLCDPNLPLSGPGRSILGTGALTQFDVEATASDAADKITKVKISGATADMNPASQPLSAIFDDRSGKKRETGPVEMALDGKEETAWVTDAGPGRRNQPRKAVFALAEPIENPTGTQLVFHLQQNHGGWNSDDNQNCNLGRIRLSVTDAAGATADPLSALAREALAGPAEKRSPAQAAELFAHFRASVPEWAEANARIEALWREHPEGSSQLVMQTRQQGRPTSVLARGDFLKPTVAVAPGTPTFLHAMPAGAAPTRLTFARWLVAENSPTAGRSIVNRIWQAYFGVGLVSTSEDLGLQSESPVHKELLDWLAVELVAKGYSQKSLHRLIVTSATYRQSSRAVAGDYATDPENRNLARGARFRLEAEGVRDVALAASGLLTAKIGGPSVFPPAPEFLFQPPASYGPKIWPESKGEDRYRRALYTFRYRSAPYPALTNFDAPNGDFSCVRRTRSNTPLQALTTLNEPLFMECARALALRAVREGGTSDGERLVYAFRRCVTRRPSADETALLAEFLARQTARFAGGVDPKPLIGELAGSLPEGVSPAQLAGWTALARVLLNLDETITKE